MKQSIGIGLSDFKELIEGNYYLIDKTLFIREIIHSGKVILCTRPRRFGKTLTLSMVKYFFDITQDNHPLFEGLAIRQEPDYEKYAGKYPVIFVSLKGVKENNWKMAYENFNTRAAVREKLRAMLALTTASAETPQDADFRAFVSGESDEYPRYLTDTGLVGTPDEIKSQLQNYIAIGISHFMLWYMDAPDIDGMQLFVEQVAPVFKSSQH